MLKPALRANPRKNARILLQAFSLGTASITIAVTMRESRMPKRFEYTPGRHFGARQN